MHNIFYKLVNDLDANWHKRSTALRHEMVSFVGQEVKDQSQEVKCQGHAWPTTLEARHDC